ncbi:iron uptake porin [Iningainema tapete]|uniref:Carbohydrate porin n=1 Tax=Iningainema tapete BLCC-T55 TaxID=2748662 RepID=A0A8J7CB96_9CYAN|nr:iron uptake porin [Iningainema tapete]MBD2778096.1 carbohydrate porin [Iningainema tapete BLCC-T55]
MLRKWYYVLCHTFAISISLLATVASAIADEGIETEVAPISEGNESLEQVTSVSQFSDVQPTDWAFAALQSLVERYGCIAGYPNGTYRGNRALTRYEFAAGVNACLDRVNELIATATADLVNKEDLTTLQRLQQEFAAELASVRGRVDRVEVKAAEIEANQFSTTTKLRGEAIFALTDVLSGDNQTVTFTRRRPIPVGVNRPPFAPLNARIEKQNTVLADRIRLNFITSFTGKDALKLRLEAGNFPHPNRPDGGFSYGPDPVGAFLSVGGDFAQRTTEGQQTFNEFGGLPSNNSVGLGKLNYEFAVGSKLNVVVMAVGGEHHEYVPTTFSSWDDDNGGTGSLSNFGQRSAIYNMGVGTGTGAGIGLTYKFSDAISLSAGYVGTYANNPAEPVRNSTFAGGLFNGRYSALAQLTVKPSDSLSFGLIYSKSYHPLGLPIFTSDLGTSLANNPIYPLNSSNLVDSYGFAGLWQVSPKFAINGWVSYSDVSSLSGTTASGTRYSGSSADVLTYGIALAFPDLGKRGNLGGIVFGASPYVTKSRVPSPLDQSPRVPNNTDAIGTSDLLSLIDERATPFHVEAFYRYRLTDNILITPGVIWLTAPNQTNLNPDVVIGTLRATFLF